MSDIPDAKVVRHKAPGLSIDSTFRTLLSERDTMLSDLRSVERSLLRKCLDEGWDDCVRLNYNMIRRRVK